MKIQQRIEILKQLGEYIGSDESGWAAAKHRASTINAWFLPEFIDLAANNIREQFLNEDLLRHWAAEYQLPEETPAGKEIGIVMAGNIPMVGFHDFLCAFVSGHRQKIKMSEKDNILMTHLIEWMQQKWPELNESITISSLLKNCGAYIATGSNNSARYFEQYFGKYPHIIRRNRTSVAILNGDETPEMLSLLADDMQQFFGLGCRNVTQFFVPEQYDFVPLLTALKKYDYFMDLHKYKHNYDYNLAIPLMNNKFYMTNGSVLLIESPSPFSPIGQIHYQYYSDKDKLTAGLNTEHIQTIVGKGLTPFGTAQKPSLTDYADSVDTLQFLTLLK
ncbi:acyl-CoA reductase [Pollutibacter soli]|uniref:acyl-CoA reductase n=1 Tax=Pollutibacter soli TaxID=3034157 RepID=UPI003013272E